MYEDIHNNNIFNNMNNKTNIKNIRSSSSLINTKQKKNSQSNFVLLVNNLCSDIKSFYHTTRLYLNQGRQHNYKSNITSEQIFDLIEQNLTDFILKAKEIFKRMKYIQKINIIQQDMNSHSPQYNTRINHNKDLIYLNSNYENFLNRNNLACKKKYFDDEIYISSYCDNSNINTNTSIKINNYIKKNNSYNDNDMIKSMNNSSKDLKLFNKNYNNYNIDENNNQKRHSLNKIIYNNCTQQYNNLIRNNNGSKNVINLRKKILFDKKQDNSSIGLLSLSNSQGKDNINKIHCSNKANNIIIRGRKDIYDNLNSILSLLKELKLIKGNIFAKTIEAEKHKNVFNKIYKELLNLVKNIFKDNNYNINAGNNSLDISSDTKIRNNNNYNITYNNKIFTNENSNKNIKTDYYNKDIKYRDLIMQQFKQENNISNDNKNFALIKKRCLELQKEKEKILAINNELKKKIIFLEKGLKDNSKKIKLETKAQISVLLTQNFSFQYEGNPEYINEKAQKLIEHLNSEIKEKNENIEKINSELNIYKEKDIQKKEEISKLNEEINKGKEEIEKLMKEIENINKQNNEHIIENKILKENLEIENQNIEKYKKLISYHEEEINNLKSNNNIPNNKTNVKKEPDSKKSSSKKNNNINIDEKKNKKRNNSKNNEYQMEQDKIYLKYELLKNDYDKLNNTLQQKQKLLDNYSKISSETASKTNIDEQILELMAEHKKEIEDLTKKYNKNIINLKMNQPAPYSPETHTILIDKRYGKYDMRWYLLTIKTEEEKNYDNTFWVSDLEMKPLLDQFDKFKTEREIEDEKFENLYKMQEKWIKQIDEKEKLIEEMRNKLNEYENNGDTNNNKI